MKSTGSQLPNKPTRKASASRKQPNNGPSAGMPQELQPSPSGDLYTLIAKRAYERYGARGYQHGSALDDWLEAEREILNHNSPA
ncbi:MAG: DUF2934 domain-containing protein [Nitrospira sp.]